MDVRTFGKLRRRCASSVASRGMAPSSRCSSPPPTMVWKIGILAVRHGVDFDDVALGRLAVILREFAERAFRLAHLRQQAAFDHDLGVGRHADFVGRRISPRAAARRAARRRWSARQDRSARSPATTSSVSGSTPMTIATSSGWPARSAMSIEHVRVTRQQQRAEPVRPARSGSDGSRRSACRSPDCARSAARR